MKAALNWPVEIIHEKCQSSIEDLFFDCKDVTINRRGVLTFKFMCCRCQETFIVCKNMLELTTFAAMSDKEFLGDDVDVFNPQIDMRPN